MRYDEKSLKLSENECEKNSIKKVQEKHYKQSFKEMKNTNNFKQNHKNELKFKKYKLKSYKLKQAGITIIALVITIIILLILAGITISMVSNDGILGKAKNAAAVSDKSFAEEEMSMYLAGIDIQKEQEGNTGRLADYLSSNVGNDGLEDFLNNGDGYAQVAYKGHNYMVNLDDGTFTYIGKTDGKGVNRHLRQILNSDNQDVPGIAMVEAGEIETEDLGWKVLSTNEDETVNLIANANTNFEVQIEGINGYTNGVKALNEICSKLYGSLEINGKKVLSARSTNIEDFYNVTYSVARKYVGGKKIEPKINQLDTKNNGFSTNQIEDYIDISNTSTSQANNTQMLAKDTSPTILTLNKTEKSTINMMNTGNNYWLATRMENYDWDSGTDGKIPYSEDLSNEYYKIAYSSGDGSCTSGVMFSVGKKYGSSGNNANEKCSLRPVITVPADSVPDASEGTTVNVDRFYKNKSGSEAHGYVKADSIAALLGKDIKSVNKVNSGLPTVESDMTWSKLTDGGYDLQSGSFDTSKYDYYIADRATKLQIRLAGASAYNNGVLALDTICNNLYGNLTEIKLANGKTKKVEVVLARNAKWEDFTDENKLGDFGSLWTTNAEDSSAPNKITSTYNSFAPTLFTQYENIDRTKGASKGYSDAKITSYNMNANGIEKWLTVEQKKDYAYEKYNNDKKSSNPWIKAIYNATWGSVANRNADKIKKGEEYWLSSRCTYINWYSASFSLRLVARTGVISTYLVFNANGRSTSSCRSLRPVLQVSK